MKKTLLKFMAASAIWVAPFFSQAQTATRLQFPNPSNMVEFGFSVTEYNGYSLFGSEFRNAVNVFHNGTFKFQAVGPVGSCFGHAIGMNSNFISAGAYQSNNHRGVVYLSKHVNGQPQNNFNTIISAQTPVDYDQFGKSIDMHNDWMVIGAPNVGRPQHGGYIEIWRYTNNAWARNKVIRPAGLPVDADFGISVAIRGDRVVVGAPGVNKAYIYKYTNNNWVLEQAYSPNMTTWAYVIYDFQGNPYYNWTFGYDVDITDGNIIVGDPVARKAGILTLQGNTWVLTKTLLPPSVAISTGDRFGHSVAIQWNRAVVGAPRHAGAGIRPDEGKVYMYTDGYNYKGHMYVGSPSNMKVRALGYGVAIDSDMVLAGASNSDNYQTTLNEGGAFRMPFYYVYQSGNWREAADEVGFVSAGAVIYPNPVKGGEVQLNMEEPVLSAEAISATGNVIPLTVTGNTVDVSTLTAGMYSIKINTGSGFKVEKLIKE